MKLTEQQWRARHKHWHEQSATDAQKVKLRGLGVEFPEDITLAEARDAISRRLGNEAGISLVTARSLGRRFF